MLLLSFLFSEAVQKTFKKSTEVSIRGSIGSILKYTPDRLGGGGREATEKVVVGNTQSASDEDHSDMSDI